MSKRKKTVGPDFIPLPSICICMCTFYTYTIKYMPRFCPPVFSGISKCLVPTPVLTSECPTCSVCVRARMHTHTYTYTPTSRQHREDTDVTPISLSVKKKPQRQQQVPFDFIGFYYWKQ